MIREGIIEIAKRNEIDITRLKVTDDVIFMDIYEKNRQKKENFLREVNRTYRRKISYIDLIRLGLDRDIKGNSLEGSRPSYLVDDPKPITKTKVEQLSLFQFI